MKRIWRMLNLIYNMLMRIFSILHVNDEFNTLIHVNFAVLYQILRNLKKTTPETSFNVNVKF